jgi:hypothetical protein
MLCQNELIDTLIYCIWTSGSPELSFNVLFVIRVITTCYIQEVHWIGDNKQLHWACDTLQIGTIYFCNSTTVLFFKYELRLNSISNTLYIRNCTSEITMKCTLNNRLKTVLTEYRLRVTLHRVIDTPPNVRNIQHCVCWELRWWCLSHFWCTLHYHEATSNSRRSNTQ